MKINEVETLLGLTRANIRFYEKEGLLTPARSENGYREYNEKDIAILKKIVIFRKLGFSLSEIKDILNNELALSSAIENHILKLNQQITELNGTLEVCKIIKKENPQNENFDEDHYWKLIQNKENEGGKFAELAKDYLEIEKKSFLSMWSNVFFLDLRKEVKKYGWKFVLLILLGISVIRGIVRKFFYPGGSFLEGFAYPFVLFGTMSIIILPIFFLHRKYKNLEPEEEKPSKHPVLMGLFKGFLLFGYFIFYLFGALYIGEEIFTLILGKTLYYTATFDLYILYYILGMYVFALFVYLYSKHGIFPDRITGKDGIRCNLPRKKKHLLAVFSVFILIISFILSMLWFDCFTEDGLIVRRLFYTKTYTWEEINYYYIGAHHDGTLSYTVVMEDGTEADCLGGMVGLANLPEDKYPDDDFVLFLTNKFAAQGTKLVVDDWDKLYRDLDYEYWIELAEEIREIAE